jgi:hypothetical protein
MASENSGIIADGLECTGRRVAAIVFGGSAVFGAVAA